MRAASNSAQSGTVAFLDGTTQIGTSPFVQSGNFSTATFTTSTLAVGTHPLSARYTLPNGGPITTNTVNQVVNQASTTTNLSSLPDPSVVNQAVTFALTVTSANGTNPNLPGPSGTFNLFDGSTQIGSGIVSSGTGSVTTSSLAVGTHTITAQYSGDGNFTSSSGTNYSDGESPRH